MPKPSRKSSSVAAFPDSLWVSPFAVHRSPKGTSFHGCQHLAALKTASASPKYPSHLISPAAQELLSNYRSCFRYSLSYRNRYHLHVNKKTKEYRVMCQLDDEEAGATGGKKRKRSLGWIDKETQNIDKVRRACAQSWSFVYLQLLNYLTRSRPFCHPCTCVGTILSFPCLYAAHVIPRLRPRAYTPVSVAFSSDATEMDTFKII